MESLIPMINSHGWTNLLGVAIVVIVALDKMGMLKRPKWMGGNKHGNPGQADIHAFQCAVMKKNRKTGGFLILECLNNIEKSTGELCQDVDALKKKAGIP